MWDAIDLSICSINEVCVGIIIANLPPLRRTILGLFSRFLPASYAISFGVSRRNTSQFYPASSHYMSKARTKLDSKGDDESERHILELEDRVQCAGIMKTTHVSIREGDAQSQRTLSLKQQF